MQAQPCPSSRVMGPEVTVVALNQKASTGPSLLHRGGHQDGGWEGGGSAFLRHHMCEKNLVSRE